MSEALIRRIKGLLRFCGAFIICFGSAAIFRWFDNSFVTNPDLVTVFIAWATGYWMGRP